MSLAALKHSLDWPDSRQIFRPLGAGPKVLASLAREKIGKAINQELRGAGQAKVGVLTRNPRGVSSEAPLAVVCEFSRPTTNAILQLAHRLAWNFCRAPLLVTVEPHRVRAWTCCERPAHAEQATLFDEEGAEIGDARLDLSQGVSESEAASHALHWVHLVSGNFFRRHPDRFSRDGRADNLLLENLKYVRRRLDKQGLDDDIIHDLLARVIFIQFLFHRKDADGNAALNPVLLARLHQKEKILSQPYSNLAEILSNYDDTYALFRWLNGKFNGDLFPGKGATLKEREAEWQAEMDKVQPSHLEELSGLVSGRERGPQRLLWSMYAFDVIPLEFISSIYEEFVTAAGAHYTPGFLVDFVLDGVLPWGGKDWDLKILDPACGSGIFLVKAYQRLVDRWKNAHRGEKPSAAVLRRLLEHNLFGVDIDPHAVRVASFSLYLAMCDEIDPKSYWKSVRFPPLRDNRLVNADFFAADCSGFDSVKDAASYDIVLGNAPWGKDLVTPEAEQWGSRSEQDWPILNKDIGTLFLPKAATLTKESGSVSMIQPAFGLLFSSTGTATKFRQKLFSTFEFTEICNFSALRFGLFPDSTSPSCIATLRPTAAGDEPIAYVCPKAETENDGEFGIRIDPMDVSFVLPNEAANDPHVWTALAWGGRRDLALIRRLRGYTTIEQLEQEGVVATRRGRSPGDRDRVQPEIVGMPYVETDAPLDASFLFLDARGLPKNTDPHTHSADSVNMEAFQLPQLLVKQSWQKETGRFSAAIVQSDPATGPVFCSRSYFSVHADQAHCGRLEAFCLTMLSSLAVYYLYLTSGRLASWIPEPNKKEMLQVPLPTETDVRLAGLSNYDDVDRAVYSAFQLKASESILVEDLFNYTIPDFKGNELSPGRQLTDRRETSDSSPVDDPELRGYCNQFVRVLRAGFGGDKSIKATIFRDTARHRLPLRLVAFHLDWPKRTGIKVERIDSSTLYNRLKELNEKFMEAGDAKSGGIFFQRIARIYDVYMHNGKEIPTIYVVKPDRVRYWTRSVAMRDADDVAADIETWTQRDHLSHGAD